mgnify:CR=1 FL=1
MTTITITRHHSGFSNVADRYVVGNAEGDGHADLMHVELPRGYAIGQYDDLIDPAGCQCVIVAARLDGKGGPMLMSLTGTCPDHLLVYRAA